MKLIKSLTILLFLFFVSCGPHKITMKISREFCKKNIEFYNNKKARSSEKKENYIRKELIKRGKLNFISSGEILYMIMGYGIVTDKTYVTIWNNKGKISFISHKKSYQIKSNLYSDGLINLIKDWNIKKLGEKKGTALDGLDLYIYKVLFNKNGEIKSIKRFYIGGYGEIN